MTRLLGTLILPSSMAYMLLGVGLAAVMWRRSRVYCWIPLAASGAINALFSSGMVAAALMSPLEYSQPTLKDPAMYPQARHIVVLTAWATDDSEMPLSGRLNPSSAYRVLLTLELARNRPDCDIVVSGEPRTAQIMRDVLLGLGIDQSRLRLDDRSSSTMQSAVNLAAMLGTAPFFLVTSGGHMPRALIAIRAQGLNAIPAPTDHQLPNNWKNAKIVPSPNLLTVSDLAVHEHLGKLWYELRTIL